jgi:prophage regulatory protein
MAQKRLLRLPAVREKTGESTTNIYVGMQSGTFPRSVPLGPHRVAWVEHEIDTWIEGRIRARKLAPPRRGGPGRRRIADTRPEAVERDPARAQGRCVP